MSDPINSVDFQPIHFPESGPSNDPGTGSRYRSSSASGPGNPIASVAKGAASAREQADIVKSRLQEAGANVRVGVESVKGSTVFTIRDAETGQVIRKIPSDEAIRISQNIDRLTGVYLDHLE